jgi:hypothetical protein
MRSGSLLYGTFDGTVANQTLQINAQTNIKGSLDVKDNTFLSGSLYTNKNIIFSGQKLTIICGVCYQSSIF